MGPATSISEAALSTSARRRRDEQLAAWCGVPEEDRPAFLERLEAFDRRSRALETFALDAELAEAADTRAGMLARVDAVIAYLVDQLFGEVRL